MLLKKLSSSNTGLPIFLCLCLLLFIGSIATAQSGRRLPKLPPKPVETTPPKETTPEENQPAKPQSKEPLIPVIIAYELPNMMSSNYLTNAVIAGCLERLQKSPDLRPQFGREMNRKEAADLAKASADTYVLWIQLDSDSFYSDRSNTSRNDTQSYYVNYVLYTPGTGKHRTQGRVYQRQRGVLPIPRGGLAGEYTLKLAGRDLADKVLNALNLPLPPDRY
jgi:hypothetical protein